MSRQSTQNAKNEEAEITRHNERVWREISEPTEEDDRLCGQELHYDECPFSSSLTADGETRVRDPTVVTTLDSLRVVDERANFEAALRSWFPIEGLSLLLHNTASSHSLNPQAGLVMVDILREVARRICDTCCIIIEKELTEVPPRGVAKTSELDIPLLDTAMSIVYSGTQLYDYSVVEGQNCVRKQSSFLETNISRVAFLLSSHHLVTYLKSGTSWSASAPWFLLGGLEYIASEFLYLCLQKAQSSSSSDITPRHIMLSIEEDAEMQYIFRGYIFPNAGVLPHILPTLFPEEDENETECHQPETNSESDVSQKEKEETRSDDECGQETDEQCLAEIKAIQSTGTPVIPKSEFRGLLQEVASNCSEFATGGFTFSEEASDAIHSAAESYIVSMFSSSNLGAIHSHRVKLFVKDVRNTQRLLWNSNVPQPSCSLTLGHAAFKRLAEEICQTTQADKVKRRRRNTSPTATATTTTTSPTCTTATTTTTANALSLPPLPLGDADIQPADLITLSNDATTVLQQAAEQYITKVHAGSLACSVHTGRMTIMPRDIQLYKRITQDFY
ncbi:hypothetical protein Pelo_10767 [Pelomyxa schiedti]|nr:hypothetical protein Pelo_10767 [Pelomyxa schiedti]